MKAAEISTQRQASVDLPEQLLTSLRLLSELEGCSLEALGATALVAVLARVTGQEEIALVLRPCEIVAGAEGPPAGRELALPRGVTYRWLLSLVLSTPNSSTAVSRVGFSGGARLPLSPQQLDLQFVMRQTDRLRLVAFYEGAHFAPSTVERWLRGWLASLDALASNPDTSYEDVDLVGADDRGLLLGVWAGLSREYPCDTTIERRFAEVARRQPNEAALVCGSQRLSYGELDLASGRLAAWLRRQDVGPGDVVAVAGERRAETYVAMLAVLRSGAAYLPLDPQHPDERLQTMVAEARCAALLSGADFAARIAFKGKQIDPAIGGIDEVFEGAPQTEPLSPSYVMFTSGSTGRPKGVVATHRGVLRLVADCDYMQFAPGDQVLQASNLSFDASTLEVWGALLNGATLVVIAPELLVHPARFLNFLREHQISTIILASSIFHALADEVPEAFLRLKNLMLGGDVLDPRRIRMLCERGRPQTLLNGYGPTENTTNSAVYRIETPPHAGFSIPIGRPISNSTCYVLDDRGRLAPIGTPGELYVGGDGLALGYLHRPELTAERFVPHPFVQGERLYRTGDRVRWRHDGMLEFLGRLDNQVKLRGHRIEPEEIEATLTLLPGVYQAAVVPRGEPEHRYLAAYVSLKGQATEDELRALLREKLPPYMLPASLVVLPELPIGPNGKIDRRALPVPSHTPDGAVLSPRTPTEQQMERLFAELLGLPRCSVEDSFYELGGDSLLAIKLLTRIREVFGLEMSGRVVFDSPSVARLSALVDNPNSTTWLPALPLPQGATALTSGPLSLFQQPLWALSQQNPHSPVYNESVILRFDEDIDPQRLERALQRLVQRHSILRTVFPASHEPTQQVEEWTCALQQVDLRADPEPEEAFADRCREQAAEPFDLGRLPLLRCTLARLPSGARLALTAHHLILDGVSLYEVFLPELGQLYQALAQGAEPELPPAPQYLDFAVRQRQAADNEARIAPSLEYWKQALADAPTLELLTDRPRPAAQAFRGRKHRIVLDNDDVRALRALASSEGVTFFTTLLTSFFVLLHRYTSQQDVVVGTMLADRRIAGADRLLGYFINPLVLRTDLSGNPSFRETLERVRDVVRTALTHQDVPFEQLVRVLKPARSRSSNPFFQAAFILEPRLGTLPAGWHADQHHIDNGTSKFDLTFALDDQPGRASLQIEYDLDLFNAETIEAMGEHFQRVLRACGHTPDLRIGDLSLLDDRERDEVLRWVSGSAQFDGETCVHRLFEAQAQQTPDAVALSHGDHVLTYQELDRRANRLAHLLRRQGVGRNVLVGLFIERGFDLVVGLLAILKAGGAYVPLDPDYPQARVSYMLEDSRASFVVTQRSLTGQLAVSPVRVVCVEDAKGLPEDAPPAVTNDPSDLIYVIYTSGSTGNPKGAMLSHRNVSRLFRATEPWFHFTSQDTWTLFHSYAFDFSVWELWGALIYGGRLVIVPFSVSRSPEAFLALLEQQGVTVLNQTPSAFRQLIHAEQARPQPAALQLRYVIFGGEALDFGSLAPWYERHPDDAPRLVNMYGITETTVHVTYRPLARADLAQPASSRIGVPIPDLGVVILDKYMQPAPIGVPGEMFVAGVGVGLGYLHREELSAQRFLPNPFDPRPSARLYRSGDRARLLRSGDIEYLGRLDDQVKVRGFRIELGEIGAAMGQHPDIRESLAIVREDTPGDKKIVGYYTSVEGRSPPTAELRSFLKGRLPDYMVPSAFVRLATIPLTSNGKINRRALPSPDPATALGAQAAPPTNYIERFLVELWDRLLAVSGIGIHDDFFSLGGNSLLTAQLLTRVREQYRIDARHSSYLLVQFLSQPTISQLARLVDRLTEDIPPSSVFYKPGSVPIAASSTTSTAPHSTPIDYEGDAALHKAIKFQAPLVERPTEPAAILLTGATGFLGAFLLAELLKRTRAEIYCLVRSTDQESGRRRLARAMAQMGLGDGKPNHRVIPVLGELSQPLLGLPFDQFDNLARSIDVIYHNGATVNFIYPYQALRSANVRGTQEVIRLAALTKRKPIHYISSLSVLASYGLLGHREVDEEAPLAYPERLHMGYLETKWVAEKMLMNARERGLPVNIFRPKDVSGHTRFGNWKTEAMTCCFIKSFVELGAVPNAPLTLDLVPADYVASAIVHAATAFPLASKNYHLRNRNYRLLQAAAERLRARGHKIDTIPYHHWTERLISYTGRFPTSGIAPFVPLFVEPVPGENMTFPEMYYEGVLPAFGSQNLDTALAGTGIECPPVSEELLDLYLEYFERIGFLPRA